MWTRPEVEALYRKTSFAIFQRCRSRLRGTAWQDSVAELLRSSPLSHDPEKTAEARAILVEALDAADERTASMLVYHYVDGLSQGEIADVMKLSRVTVNQRLQRFRDQAKEIAEREP